MKPRRTPVWPAFISLLLLLPALSCSGHYLKNRGRDLADIFTAEVSTGSYGASVRVGPVKAGVSYKSPKGKAFGLRGGAIGSYYTAEFTALFFGADYFLSAPPSKETPPSSKKSPAGELFSGSQEENASPPEEEQLSAVGPDLREKRDKSFQARSPFGTRQALQKKPGLFKGKKDEKHTFAPVSYYTQVELSLGLYLGLKVGFNPGELLDFLAGLFNLDLFHDDEPLSPRGSTIEDHPLWNRLSDEEKRRLKQIYGDREVEW